MQDKSLDKKITYILIIVVFIAAISTATSISGQAARKIISGPGGGSTTTTIVSETAFGYYNMYVGDYALPCSGNIILENVGTGAVLVDVNGVKATVDAYQTEVVNGCRISVLDLKYDISYDKSSAVLAMDRHDVTFLQDFDRSVEGIFNMKIGYRASTCSGLGANSKILLENVGIYAILVDVDGQKATIDLGQSEYVNGCTIKNVEMDFRNTTAMSSAILRI